MIVWIKEWSQGIVIAVIIATIIEMLLPDNNNKKYISSIIGIYILFSIISPVISKFTGSSINIEEFMDKTTYTHTKYTMNNVALLENSSNVEDLYIKTLKDDITSKLKKSGFKVESIELKIDSTAENNYGQIIGIDLHISILDENAKICNINEVKINISENINNDKKNSSVSAGQINQIKEILMDTYGIEKEVIHVW